ncbi:MAG: hypothetical protein N2999_05860 [Proteobacteria bacterium]|nr:hypothetical protein [Pseudomonadota bacterium]
MNKEEIKQDLDNIERKIEQLKIEYEKFFVGITKIEPVVMKNQIVQLIKKYASHQFNNVMLSFRYKNLLARFLTYQEYWNRILKLIEEGKNPKDYRKIYEKFIQDAEKNILPVEPSPSPKTDEMEPYRNLYIKYTSLLEKRNKKAPSLETFVKTINDYENKVKEKYGPDAIVIFEFEEAGDTVKIKSVIKK